MTGEQLEEHIRAVCRHEIASTLHAIMNREPMNAELQTVLCKIIFEFERRMSVTTS